MHAPIQTYLAELHGRLAGTHRGELASYIPELAKADPQSFGISVVTVDGVAYSVGDTHPLFTMQSISKPFVYATALADRGERFVTGKVGVEPSGDAFNSISLDPQTGAPLNPMINACAIATTSLVAGRTTGAAAPSRRQPPAEMRAYLNEHARRIKYLCLHGFLAVDGVEYIIRRMRHMAPDTDSFILDMHEVAGISESAARLLNQARLGSGEDDDIAVVCSRVRDRPAILGPMSKSVRRGDRGFLVFEDNDLALEWCENRLVRKLPRLPAAKGSPADSVLFRGLPERLLRQVEVVARPHVYAQGEQILKHGQQGDGRVFFIESGHVSILLPLETGAHQRIASLGPGMEFGEMALACRPLTARHAPANLAAGVKWPDPHVERRCGVASRDRPECHRVSSRRMPGSSCAATDED